MSSFLRFKKLSKPKDLIVKPRLPEGVRIYAMTDIHGRADLLQNMFTVIDRDLENIGHTRPVHVFMGDYIDRGPFSRQTIDLLIQRGDHHECVFLKGNHEEFLFEVLRDSSRLETWAQHGALQTLKSYGLQPTIAPGAKEQERLVSELMDNIPSRHKRFFNELESNFVCGDFFFVHAGVRPGVALDQQSEEDMLWIRDDFLNFTQPFAKYVVHGHTPVSQADVRSNRINIDTGAYATGNLTLLSVQGSSLLAI